MARATAVALLVAAGLLGGAALHNVGTAPTAEDRDYGARIVGAAGYDAGALLQPPAGFAEEIRLIAAVQDAVLRIAPGTKPLPHGQSREPRDLWELRQGWCFDRSRGIEKILAAAGMEVRHLAAYRTDDRSRLLSLLTPDRSGERSHALSEVRTRRGWMLVDSNARWFGLDTEGRVWSAEALQGRDPFAMAWAPEVPEAISWPGFGGPFTYVIGLYSRHGGFFPPYTPVPDVNYADLLENLY